MKKALIGLIKLAMDARYTDEELAKLLREAADAVGSGRFWTWSQP